MLRVERAEMERFWRTGVPTQGMIDLLKKLVEDAAAYLGMFGPLFSYRDELITFTASRDSSTINVFYGWNYPPKEFWQPAKGTEECRVCYPNGPHRDVGREVWCTKVGFNYQRCPYGVETSRRPGYVS